MEASRLTKSFEPRVSGTSGISRPLLTCAPLASGSLACNNSCPTGLFRDSRDACESDEDTITYDAQVRDGCGQPKLSLTNFAQTEVRKY